ncbi:hypothetical protein IM697_42500 [Streptomyces ferrugineus]|uniref:Uncharacterized protein n=1 Tax=Streptomyces ferrugineus TaxID=1413221 RepID=A0A7M2SKP9_9ACTN|nr:hypothetical protein [Streptomyces ferrugineus]QOV36579.1 hypothetical protein IM697_42500 [Streptomyces ferrugineus]
MRSGDGFPTRGTATEATRLHCFSDELQHLAKNDPTVQLIDLTRLYHGE